MEEKYIRQLIEQYFNGSLSEGDRKALVKLLNGNEPEVIKVLNAMQEDLATGHRVAEHAKMKLSLARVLSVDKEEKTPVFPIRRQHADRRWLVAASIILLIGIAMVTYRLFHTPQIVPAPTSLTLQDVQPPQEVRAMITLADGRQVYLDSLPNGEVAQQGGITVVRLADGQIAYQARGSDETKEIQYNTLSNPRGSRVIDLTLADGTRVWLNAASSITYPVAFAGDERRVDMKGEGYLEVAPNEKKPFNVSVGGLNVKVLGTHFNINAYPDEDVMSTTLLEGRVEVSNRGKSVILKPGQQALLQNTSSDIQTIDNIDTATVMAWKNGYFSFDNTTLKSLMRQVSRWYNVEVAYEGVPSSEERFIGEVPRNSNVSEVLKILELSNVRSRIEGNKIIIEQ